MRSSKRGSDVFSPVAGHHMNTLHQRLYDALNLGSRVHNHNDRKWQCTDIEIQRHVVRSIAAFLDCFQGGASHDPFLTGSVADMTGALVYILQCKSGAVVSMAASVTVKLVNIIPKSTMQLYASDFLQPLLSLLNFPQTEVALSSAVALNKILTSLNEKQEKTVWKILEDSKTIAQLLCNIQDFSSSTMPLKYFEEMVSLLSTLLLRWPPSRYRVYSDATFMKVLQDVNINSDPCIRVGVLKLYSALSLCVNGAEKLLEAGRPLLEMVVYCMDVLWPQNERIEAFKLMGRLVTDEKKCSKLITTCCEPLVKATICGMDGWTSHSSKSKNDQMPLVVEACRLALITRWPGEHHILFLKHGIAKVLLNLLLEDMESCLSGDFSALAAQIFIAQRVLHDKFLLNLRPYVWDILGWLATHGAENFVPGTSRNEVYLDPLIVCACLYFWDSVRKGQQIRQGCINEMSRDEAASRAVLLMIYSPCKYIASRARDTLSYILRGSGDPHVKRLLRFLHYTSCEKNVGHTNLRQSVICLVGLTCFSGLEPYWKHVIENHGMQILLSFSEWCMVNRVRIGRSSLSPHLQNPLTKRICCETLTEAWDDKDIPLLYSLWALAELVYNSCSLSDDLGRLAGVVEHSKIMLQEVRDGCYAPGPRIYAMRVLSYFGHYGFPSNFGNKGSKVLREEKFGDLQLVLANGDSVTVHKVVLAVRSPSLLTKFDFSKRNDGAKQPKRILQEVRLSSSVDNQVLLKLLEFVYTGYVEVEERLVKKLKTLTRHCNLQHLLQMLSRKRPTWGSSIPRVDLSLALGLSGSHFSDIILEAKESEVESWSCGICSLTQPHLHAHKVILWASCEYLRALFQSGMRESFFHKLEVPISFEAMAKLVNWFYTDELPEPPLGCIWNNMGFEEKLKELQSYVEIYSLSQFWILEGLKDVCIGVIESRLDSARELCVKILQLAADFSLWELAKTVAEYAAPMYQKLRDSSDLQELDDGLVDMLRFASVRLSQEMCD